MRVVDMLRRVIGLPPEHASPAVVVEKTSPREKAQIEMRLSEQDARIRRLDAQLDSRFPRRRNG